MERYSGNWQNPYTGLNKKPQKGINHFIVQERLRLLGTIDKEILAIDKTVLGCSVIGIETDA